MQPFNTPWNSLEIVKLVLGVLTPLSVACLGWLVARRLKRLELVQWTNQRLIEKRLTLYDTVAPQLNALLCFYTWIGYWKDISPDDVIRAKRDLDRTFHIYRYLFDEDVYDAYHTFIHALFEMHTGPGRDARIRSLIQAPDRPCWRKRYIDGAIGKRSCVAVMPVSRCPRRTESGRSTPRISRRRGL